VFFFYWISFDLPGNRDKEWDMITSKKDLRVYKAESGMWYYTFRIPARFHPEGKVGEQVRRSSGKLNEVEAREVAWQDFLKVCGMGGAAANSERKSFRAEWPTVSEVCERYVEVIRRFSDIKERSVAGNVQALKRHVRRAGEDPDKLRMDQLSEALVLRSRKAFYEERGEDWDDQDPSLNYSLNSEHNQASSVLGVKASRCWEGWRKMPEVIGFNRAPRLPQKHTEFLGIPTMAEMDAAALAWRETEPVGWVCYELARWAGLRCGEVAAFEPGRWLVERGGTIMLDVRPRGRSECGDGLSWSPKRNKARAVPLRPERVAAWRAAFGGAWPEGYLVPGACLDAREKWLARVVNGWIAPWLPDREKRLHELRKQAGSEVYTTQGAAAAAEFLGDTLETTMRHYARFLGKVSPV
jgi:hypothetical protein